jgi:hypothetical protein
MGLFSRKPLAAPVAASGAIVMYDSTSAYAIPGHAQLVAGYVDGYVSYPEMVSRFGKAKVVSISVNNNDADVADVEPGAMLPSDLPAWVDRQHARGVRTPVVYSDGSQYPQCYDYVGDRVSYWTADPVGYPITLPGRSAVQYLWTSSWDASWVLPSFPFYPGHISPPSEPELREGAIGSAVKVAQHRLNVHRVADGVRQSKKYVNLNLDGVFGPKTEAHVKEFQRVFKLEVDGIIGPHTWAALKTK